MDQVIVNYHNSLLYTSDLKILDERDWLNDRLIGFIYEYFENELFDNLVARRIALFVNPDTVQYLKLCPSLEEAKICFLEALEMSKFEVVFFPLNNNSQNDMAGGTHWSLLVLFKSSKSIIHLDSIGSNDKEAKAFYTKFKDYFSIENFVADKSFPRQTNSSDCGLYLLGLDFSFF